ncbi:TlpA disulfide reductase family protein [Flavivirga amylovorans]|uniref:TlpA disulfide reductase family protein n=1 Tax=Flavivirga amylovorans TaxID=870486 RepID=A0ABT8WWP3_9FLAO|nr:TlpA disulfide reductase family protein [Flavivirga amylovorans]MDO5985809.1 TlpA disulfide reductase family protein [Flavivirga amylovorans]
MNKIITVLILSCVILSCKNDTKRTIDYAILSGNISNAKLKADKKPYLKISSLSGFSKKIIIAEDGTFNDTLHLDGGIYYTRYARTKSKLYMTPNTKIKLTADSENYLNTLNYEGDHADMNNYLVEVAPIFEAYKYTNKEKYILEPDIFLKKLDEAKSHAESVLAQVKKIPDSLRQLEKKDIYYNYLEVKSNYSDLHAYYIDSLDYIAPEEFEMAYNEVSFNSPKDFFYSKIYRELVELKISKKAYDLRDETGLDIKFATLNVIASEIEDETIRNLMLIEQVTSNLSRANDEEKYYNEFLKFSTNVEDKKTIEKLYKSLSYLLPGNSSPKFSAYENHAGGTKSLDDFKGKYVYIDVWATWCTPCIKELPYLKEVEKDYHDRNIAFVSISVDRKSDYEKWRTMVTEENFGGIQLFADNGFKSDFMKDYKINSIPRFILIDPDGNIVKANAPRPSDKKRLTNLLSELNL